MRKMMCTLSASAALFLTSALFASSAQAADGSFHYRTASDTTWQTMQNPMSDKCHDLGMDVSIIQNKTNNKALLYRGFGCDEARLHTALVPNETWDGMLSTVRSVRFEAP